MNASQPVIDHWTFGGGTALMLQLQHRESRDIDIFLSDPQALRFLDPSINDLNLEFELADYRSDGARFLKLSFQNVGEIDFIVAGGLTPTASKSTTIMGEDIQLETIQEIITKKVFYRGASIKPRDIFDIAAAAQHHSEVVISSLRPHRKHVQTALSAIRKLNPRFVSEAIEALAITDAYRPLVKTATEQTRSLLEAVQ